MWRVLYTLPKRKEYDEQINGFLADLIHQTDIITILVVFAVLWPSHGWWLLVLCQDNHNLQVITRVKSWQYLTQKRFEAASRLVFSRPVFSFQWMPTFVCFMFGWRRFGRNRKLFFISHVPKYIATSINQRCANSNFLCSFCFVSHGASLSDCYRTNATKRAADSNEFQGSLN